MESTSNEDNRKVKEITIKATADISDIDIATKKVARLCDIIKEANSLIKELTSVELNLKINIER